MINSMTEDQIVRLYERGQSIKGISQRLHLATSTVSGALHRRGIVIRGRQPNSLPTPEEVEARKAEIQRGWDVTTERLRAGANGRQRVVLEPVRPLRRADLP